MMREYLIYNISDAFNNERRDWRMRTDLTRRPIHHDPDDPFSIDD